MPIKKHHLLTAILIFMLGHSLLAQTIRVCKTCDIKTFQGGIDAAKDNDTIIVEKGIYKEIDILVNKAVTIIGKNYPVIDGEMKGEIITVVSDNVTLDGLFIKNVGTSYTSDYAAVRLKRVENFVVKNLVLENLFFGIYVEKSKNGKVFHNKIIGDAKEEYNSGNGIQLWYSQNIEIEHNFVQRVRDGIYLEFSDNCLIKNNVSSHNVRYGLHFMFSNDDVYEDNLFEKNGAGVAVMFSRRIKMINNIFRENWGTASYGLLLKEINDAEIMYNTFEQNTIGINTEGSNRINYINNNFINNGWAVKVLGACYTNIFEGNNFLYNSFDVAYNSKVNDNEFDKNYWSSYTGYDLDKDGVGDVPYRPVKLFSYIVNRTPETIILLRSMFIDIIDFSEKVSPVFTPDNLLDNQPQIKKANTVIIENLHKKFGKNQVLSGLDLTISEGGIFAVLEPNGSGKTTLIKAVLGMVIPDKGKITVLGENIKKNSEYRHKIDYLPQIANFPSNLKVKELIKMIKDLREFTNAEDKLIELFRLEPFLDKKLGNLSGGTKQKVNLVLTFMFNSPLIILDEPTTGLDPISLIRLKNLIQEEKTKGKTILITSHIMSFVEEVSDEIVFLLEGKIYFKGTILELKNKTNQPDFEHAIASILIDNHAKILKYSFYDLMRSRWSYVYFAFYLLLGIVLLFLNNDLSKAVITLMNVIIVLVPLIGTIFGVMYYYNSKEFTELLLAQPLKRSSIFLGQYLGVALSLSMSLILGLGLPFVFYGLFESSAIWDFSLLLVTGTFLTLIFTALAFNIALSNENKIKGFGYAILLWLFLAVIYDGLFLMTLVMFDDYPLDKLSLIGTMLNPIDLSRTLILLKLDISALLGYTGAVFKQFFGTNLGLIVSFIMLTVWVILPVLRIVFKSKKKDF